MPSRGPAPKPPDQRRRRNEPRAGEWVALPPAGSFEPTMPAEPPLGGPTGRRQLHRETQLAWAAWRADPSSSQYGEAELRSIRELALLHDEYFRSRDIRYLAELRQREDRLGLNPKGKRDLRWIAPTERGTVAGDTEERPMAQVRALRAIDTRSA